MKRYSLKKDYYDQLRQDYYKEGEKSFVFRYLERNPRSDTCFRMVLGQKWEELKAGRISCLDYVQYIIEKLSRTPKLYQEGRDYKLILPLLYYGIGLSEDEYQVLEHTGRKKDIQEKLLLLEKQMQDPDGAAKERLSKIPINELECMTRRLELVALQVEVRNFFYEIGFPVTDANKPQKEEAAKRKPERKKDPSLNMLDAYCAQKNLSLFVPSERTRQDCGEDYDVFFQKLVNSGNPGIMIPIMIDPQTGSSLFILGRKYINDFQYVISKSASEGFENYCCAYGILELDTDGSNTGASRDYQELMFYHVTDYLFDYSEAREEYEIVRRANLANIRDYNKSLEGMEHPKSLDIYFSWDREHGEMEDKHEYEITDEKFLEIMTEAGPRETPGRSKSL